MIVQGPGKQRELINRENKYNTKIKYEITVGTMDVGPALYDIY